jgi:hypothetical protein
MEFYHQVPLLGGAVFFQDQKKWVKIIHILLLRSFGWVIETKSGFLKNFIQIGLII